MRDEVVPRGRARARLADLDPAAARGAPLRRGRDVAKQYSLTAILATVDGPAAAPPAGRCRAPRSTRRDLMTRRSRDLDRTRPKERRTGRVSIDDRVGMALRASGLVDRDVRRSRTGGGGRPDRQGRRRPVADVELSGHARRSTSAGSSSCSATPATTRIWRDDDVSAFRGRRPAHGHRRTRSRGRPNAATAQGLLQGYRRRGGRATRAARPAADRGPADPPTTGSPLPLEVRYDDYDVDIAENQILRRRRRGCSHGARRDAQRPTDALQRLRRSTGRRHAAASRRAPSPRGSRRGSTRATTSHSAWPSWSCAAARSSSATAAVRDRRLHPRHGQGLRGLRHRWRSARP